MPPGPVRRGAGAGCAPPRRPLAGRPCGERAVAAGVAVDDGAGSGSGSSLDAADASGVGRMLAGGAAFGVALGGDATRPLTCDSDAEAEAEASVSAFAPGSG